MRVFKRLLLSSRFWIILPVVAFIARRLLVKAVASTSETIGLLDLEVSDDDDDIYV